MNRNRKSLLIWAIAAALSVQLAVAFSHVHGDRASTGLAVEKTCQAVPAKLLRPLAPDPGDAAAQCLSSAAARDASIAGKDAPPADGEDFCDLCWVLAALSALIVPLVIALLRHQGPPRRFAAALREVPSGTFALAPYQARAPPSLSHA